MRGLLVSSLCLVVRFPLLIADSLSSLSLSQSARTAGGVTAKWEQGVEGCQWEAFEEGSEEGRGELCGHVIHDLPRSALCVCMMTMPAMSRCGMRRWVAVYQ